MNKQKERIIYKKQKETVYICHRCFKDMDKKRLDTFLKKRGEEVENSDYFVNLKYACCDKDQKSFNFRFITRDNYLDNYVFHDPFIEINKFKPVKI